MKSLLMLAFLFPVFAFGDQEIPFVAEPSPSVEINDSGDNISLTIKVKSQEIKLSKEEILLERWESFEKLSPQDQEGFLKNRKYILELFAKSIYYPSLAGGTYVVTKEKIINLYKTAFDKEKIESQSITGSAEEVRIALIKKVEEAIWNNVNLVQKSNEFGMHFAIGLIGVAGAGLKGKGGAISLFMNFSYHREHKAMVFEIGFDHEAYAQSGTGVVNVAAFWKAYPFLRYTTHESFQGHTKGQATYPPGVVGVTSIHNDFYGMGYTDSPIGFPSLLAMVMHYENHLNRTTLLRLSVSTTSISIKSVVGEVVTETWHKLSSLSGIGNQCANVF